ncbi:MAG TPA: TonB-dependent receptor [Candidatus Elarobacter sp.]|nr:TonB-dependent receptor [Candidatus Elarobacter sp.]
MIAAILAAALTIVAVPDPGTSAAGALVRVHAAEVSGRGAVVQLRLDARGRAVVDVPPQRYIVDVSKPGFVPARATATVRPSGATVRIALHAVATNALRTIGSVSAAQRGAFNAAPAPLVVVPREAYRDMSQPGLDDVLTQKPSILIDRAGRGLGAGDAPPVALVRGGTPLETQTLIEGVPVALATTRTIPLSAIPTFTIGDLEVLPGASAPLPTVDGAIGGTINLRFADPTPVWRALPEQGFDGRGGSFTDIAGGGATADRNVAFAVAATVNGATGDVTATDAIQRALLLRARAALSPASGLTLTSFNEGDSDDLSANRFAFDELEYRLDGTNGGLLARAWHVTSQRDGIAAGDPLETQTNDALDGASLEYDRTVGTSLLGAGVTETYATGTAAGAVDVLPGSFSRVQTAFVRAIVRPASRWQAQLAAYGVDADTEADGLRADESGFLARVGLSYRVSDALVLRASSGSGFAPPSLVALAGLRNAPGAQTATTDDAGLEAHVIDAHTTLSADVFSSRELNRYVEVGGGPVPWLNEGASTRTGAELSLARFVPAGFGYLLQAWTVNDAPSIARSIVDVAAAGTQGYAEVSYHAPNGSRISFGATYYGADPALDQPSAVLFNANLEIQIGARGKIQFDLENLNDARLAVPSLAVPLLPLRSASAPAPRTFRVVVRRSIGRTGTDY